MCKKDDEALRLLGEVVKSQGERTDLDNNVNEVSRSSGNSKSYTLDRLAPETTLNAQFRSLRMLFGRETLSPCPFRAL